MADYPTAAAGQLRWRIRFERTGLDANGDPLGEFAHYYTCAARLQFVHGGETMLADRLEGKQPVVITVRACEAVAGITTADRAVDERTGVVYDIGGIEPDLKRVWVDILAVSHAGGTPA